MMRFALLPLALLLTALLLPAAPRSAEAAAFCLVANTMAPLCTYESIQQCTAASENPTFGCIPNPNEMQQVYGSNRYCVATEQRIQYCIYSDYSSCNADAPRKKGVCYDHGAIGPTDPYQYDTRRPPY